MTTRPVRLRRGSPHLRYVGALFAGLGLCIGPASAQVSASDGCIFDQQAQKQRMREAVARRSRGRLDADANAATWQRRNGDTVSVAYGGCADLGTTVTLRYGGERRAPSTRDAIGRLLAAIETYWSPAEAAYVGKAIRAAQDRAVRDETGTVDIAGPLEPGPGFSFGFELRLTPEQASVSWQGG